MNKQDLVKAVAKKAGISQKDAAAAVDAVLDTVKGAVAKKDEVRLVGFGSFMVKARKARKGRNPQTGEAIKIPATHVPVFRAGKALKDAAAKQGKKKK